MTHATSAPYRIRRTRTAFQKSRKRRAGTRSIIIICRGCLVRDYRASSSSPSPLIRPTHSSLHSYFFLIPCTHKIQSLHLPRRRPPRPHSKRQAHRPRRTRNRYLRSPEEQSRLRRSCDAVYPDGPVQQPVLFPEYERGCYYWRCESDEFEYVSRVGAVSFSFSF